VKVFLGDGRALRYWASATDGPVVLFFHGTPDSRRVAMTGADAAAAVGVRLLAFSRPGYGGSTPTDSTLATVAHDAAALLDVWGIERVAVVGMSVGAMYAAAFAATYPDRTNALALVSAPAPGEPTDESVEDAMERMRPEFMAWRAGVDPDDEDEPALAMRFLAELPASDAALLRPFGEGFVVDLVWEAIGKPEGYLRDAALLLRPWDLDATAVTCPTTLWVGDRDDKAVAASSWWAERIPQATVEMAPGTTHLATLLSQWPQILRRLSTGPGTATG
jgi:pimeloyl-ACP methyl ester carboxylesterase